MGKPGLSRQEIESLGFVLDMARTHALDPETTRLVSPRLIPRMEEEQRHLNVVEKLLARAGNGCQD